MTQGLELSPRDAGIYPGISENSRLLSAERSTVRWAVVVSAAVFGPYVAGVTTGELVVVAGGFFLLFVGWPRLLGGALPLLPAVGIWLAICAVALIANLSRAIDPSFYGAQSAEHALWWLLMPVLVIAISCYWTRRVPAKRLIVAIARVAAIAMAANSVLAAIQLALSDADFGGIGARFWGAVPGGTTTVASLSAQNGRYTGIFDQPAEAGTAYGIALLCVVYLLQRGEKGQLATAFLVTAGGVVSISKVFILVALPLAAWLVVRSPRVRRRVLAGAVLAAAAVTLAGSAGLLPAWKVGRSALGNFVHPGGSLTTFYTADRYGSGGGTLGSVAADVLHAAPWAGFGIGGLNTPYDSLWIQVLVLSGLVGLALLLALLVLLSWRWLQLKRADPSAETTLAGSVLLLAVFSSLGFPALTAGRVGILIWLLLGVSLAEVKRPAGLGL